MNFNRFVFAIENESQDRDLRLDDLTDVINDADISEAEANAIVIRLDNLLGSTGNADELESYFYLLASLYFKDRATTLIEDIVLKRLDTVGVGALIHCVEIIADSNLPAKQPLLQNLLQHSNPAIRNLVSRRIS